MRFRFSAADERLSGSLQPGGLFRDPPAGDPAFRIEAILAVALDALHALRRVAWTQGEVVRIGMLVDDGHAAVSIRLEGMNHPSVCDEGVVTAEDEVV